jgi:hypothetical protein
MNSEDQFSCVSKQARCQQSLEGSLSRFEVVGFCRKVPKSWSLAMVTHVWSGVAVGKRNERTVWM